MRKRILNLFMSLIMAVSLAAVLPTMTADAIENPANITKVSFTTSANAVKMSWNKVSGATGYRVYKYNTSTNKWQGVANTKGTSYTFSKLKSGTTYKFTVRAYKTYDGKTYLSPKYSTFTSSTNPAAVNFTLSTSSKKATVKWNKVTGATGYKVYYKTSANDKWIGLKTTDNKTTSYTKTGLTNEKTYYFTVKAYRTVGGKTYNGAYTTKTIKVPSTTTSTQTQPYWCYEGGSTHVMKKGIGWYNSYDEAYKAGGDYINENHNGNGGWYVDQCECGKWTVEIRGLTN